MNKLFITSITIIGFLFIGCGSKSGPDLSPEASSKTVKNVPDWYLDTPKTEGYLYAASNATSQSMQLAVDKARMQAVSELSQMMKSEWGGYTKRVQEEIGTGLDSKLLDTFTQTQENTISNQLETLKKWYAELGHKVDPSSTDYVFHLVWELEFELYDRWNR